MQRLQQGDGLRDLFFVIYADAAGGRPAADRVFADAPVTENADRTALGIHHEADAAAVALGQLLNEALRVESGHARPSGVELGRIARDGVALLGVQPQLLAAARLENDRKDRLLARGDVKLARRRHAACSRGAGDGTLVVRRIQNFGIGDEKIADPLKLRPVRRKNAERIGADGEERGALGLRAAEGEQPAGIGCVVHRAVQPDAFVHAAADKGGRVERGLGRGLHGEHAVAGAL